MRILAFLAVVALAGCSTVESRIKKQPEVFQNLPDKQKDLVTRGEVSEGMMPPAVFLAWGEPDNVINGSERGHPVEEWIYEATRSDVVTDLAWEPGYYGHHGRLRGGWDNVVSPVVITQSYPYKSVRFEDGKVVSWRRGPLR